MADNLEFARVNKIKVDPDYIVTPHHSGVYPILTRLYKAWSETFSVKASSAQSYPLTSPLYMRRGFMYNNVMVAPRQSSFMFTKNRNFDSLNATFDYWIDLYNGGGLFEIMLYNQVSIFMTHVPNFAHDRIANFIFLNVFQFLSCWTNLKFYSLPPLKIAEKYFEFNPEDKELYLTVWRNLNFYIKHEINLKIFLKECL